MTKYNHLKDCVEKLMCPMCGGSGKVEDAEPGDISFNKYKCSSCNSTGLNSISPHLVDNAIFVLEQIRV